MTDQSIQRIYQFLASQTNWAQDADTQKKDGIIVKSEFENYIKKNWNELGLDGTLGDEQRDIINEFWNRVDTEIRGFIGNSGIYDMNALSKKEQEAMNNRIGAFGVISEFVEKSDKLIPSGVDKNKFKKLLQEELIKAFDSELKNGNISAIQSRIAEVAQQIIKEVSVKTFTEELLERSEYKEYKDLLKGEFDSIVKEYAAQADKIEKADVEKLLKAYLATAGICEAPEGVDLSKYGYNPDPNGKISELQKAVIEKNYSKAIQAELKVYDYDNNKELYDGLIKEYVDSVANKMTYSTFKAEYTKGEFLKSEQGQKAQNLIALLELINGEEFEVEEDDEEAGSGREVNRARRQFFLEDLDDGREVLLPPITPDDPVTPPVTPETPEAPNATPETRKDFFTLLKEAGLSEAVITRIKGLHNGETKYTNILDIAKRKAISGEFNTDGKFDKAKALKWFVEELNKAFSLENTTETETRAEEPTDLYKAFNEVADDTSKTIQEVREAAIAYCKSVAAKSEIHKQTMLDVIKEYGYSDYTEAINKLDSWAIKELLGKINSAITNIKVPSRTENVIEALGDTVYKRRVQLTFRVLNDGTIDFVKTSSAIAKGGIYKADANDEVNEYFKKVRKELESEYKKELDALKLTDTQKANLYNIALLQTLSDVSVLANPYEIQEKIYNVIKKLCDNYKDMLENLTNNPKAVAYLKDYAQSKDGEGASILAGRNLWAGTDIDSNDTQNVNGTMTRDMRELYAHENYRGLTYDNDDWVRTYSKGSLRKTSTVQLDGYGSANIILLENPGVDGDNKIINDRLKLLLEMYIGHYKNYIDIEKIKELYKKAEEIAFNKMDEISKTHVVKDTSIYGFSDRYNSNGVNMETYDTLGGGSQNDYALFSVQSILLEVMYEMERLLNQEIMGLS